jgi:hypothetical protein
MHRIMKREIDVMFVEEWGLVFGAQLGNASLI